MSSTKAILLLGVALASAGAALDDSSLERELDVVEGRGLAADIRFLADEALGGRSTPSSGLDHAARYIRARLARLGFEPGGDDGYLDHYRMEKRRVDLQWCYALVERGQKKRRLVPGEHYYFHRPEEIDLEAQVVFAGAGRPEDLAEADLRGRWALVLEDQVPWLMLRDLVRDAGAVGLLVASEKHEQDRHGPGRAKRVLESLDKGRLDVAQDVVKPFPLVFLSRPQSRFLLSSGLQLPGARLGTFQERRALAPPLEIVEAENVCGFLRGSDSELRREVLVITTNFDHLGIREGRVLPGANGSASGTSALLGIAEALAAHGPLRRSVLLLWVSAGMNQRGSLAWTVEPTLPRGYEVVANIDLGALGHNAPEELQLTPSPDHPSFNGLTRLAQSLAPLEGFAAPLSCDPSWDHSDHINFEEHLNVPVLHLFGGLHPGHHEPNDTADGVDIDKVRRAARLVVRMLGALQKDELGL